MYIEWCDIFVIVEVILYMFDNGIVLCENKDLKHTLDNIGHTV